MNPNLRLVLGIMADDVRLMPDCERDIWTRLKTVMGEAPELRIKKELETLISSVEYKDRLRQRTEQWLKSGGRIYINTVVWLLDCRDSQWDDLLMRVPDDPGFSHVLEWFAVHRRWLFFKHDKDLAQKWADGIAAYLNGQTVNNEIRWNLLVHLGMLACDLFHNPQIALASEKDRLFLQIYSVVYDISRDFKYQLSGDDLKEKFEHEIAEVASHLDYTPRFIIHHEIPGEKARLSQTKFGIPAFGKNRHYYLVILISGTRNLYEYIVLDAYLEEIQLGTYATPLTADEFIDIFGFDAVEIASQRPWLNSFLNIEYQTNEGELLQAWEAGSFGNWERLSFGNAASPDDTDAKIAVNIRRWVKAHGQEAPIHALLAQVLLNRYDPEKNRITRKALNSAISCYMEGQVPERQRNEAYEIIERAIQAQVPLTERVKQAIK